MKPFTLISKVTKLGNVKVCVCNKEESHPLYIMKYPNLFSNKYYTICRIDPIKKENEVSYKHKETILSCISEFKDQLKIVGITISEEKHMETFSINIENIPNKRTSCDLFSWF
jgi:hypothetical protein